MGFCALQGDKNIIKFEGDHNSPRPQFYFDSINIFFHNVLQPPEDEVGESFYDPVNDYFGKVKSTMHIICSIFDKISLLNSEHI
jgi:hypothetical protein